MFNELIDPRLIRYRVCRYCGSEFMAKNLRMVFCTEKCSNTYYNQFKRIAAPFGSYLNGSEKDYTLENGWDYECDDTNVLLVDDERLERNLEILKGFQLDINEKIVIEKSLMEKIEFDFNEFILKYQYTHKINNEERIVYQFEEYAVEFVIPTVVRIERSY